MPSVVELRLAGELDGDTSAELREKLSVFAARSSGGLLVLNLSGITFCDSVSLYTLLAIRQALPLAGIEVRLAEPSAVTRAAAKRVGLTADLALPDDPEQVPPHRSPRL
ncbi:STAS domain-containing protein [Streptomyces sp. NPDC005574]|uniref:STAS domain-containing protein n=1 Tax=Streptomyces sp. NPDC005574 TaxID=3156891 RepID=UPI0033B17117